jgi:uncharacterized protein involved in exopolysaccharide biosynthesis
MELRELIQIFQKQYKTFWLLAFIFILLGLAWQYLPPESFKTELSLNITRQGKQDTAEYQYDDFYRLQADERFADTAVRWLGSAMVLENIKKDAQIDGNLKIKSQRLSSQYINVTFVTNKLADSKKISDAITKELNRDTDELNQFQKQENWFTIIGGDPVVTKNELPISKLLLLSLLAGLFFGFWGVLIKHYLKNN